MRVQRRCLGLFVVLTTIAVVVGSGMLQTRYDPAKPMNIEGIHLGMSPGDIRSRLGEPDKQTTDHNGLEHWSYPVGNGDIIWVIVSGGKVVRVETWRRSGAGEQSTILISQGGLVVPFGTSIEAAEVLFPSAIYRHKGNAPEEYLHLQGENERVVLTFGRGKLSRASIAREYPGYWTDSKELHPDRRR